MIPYILVPDIVLGPLRLHPFGILVALGVIAGTSLAVRRARALGLDTRSLESFITWLLIGGFVGGHVLDELLYHPAAALARPWTLLFLWEGLSSFGGFLGAIGGIVLWKHFERLPGKGITRRATVKSVMPFADVIMSVFPIAWAFGRAGCSVVHDHPGTVARSATWLAVAYGPGPVEHWGPIAWRFGSTPCFDLGLLELFFTLSLSAIFAIMWRRSLPCGSYVAAACIAYAPVRFALDFLRAGDGAGGDIRYALLTPAQWLCFALLVVGVAIAAPLVVARRGDPATASGQAPA